MRLHEASPAHKCKRLRLVIAHPCLNSGCTKRLSVTHHSGQQLSRQALPLPFGVDGQIKTISPGPKFPQSGIGHTLVLPGFHDDITRRILARCAELLRRKPCGVIRFFTVLGIDSPADLAVTVTVTSGPRTKEIRHRFFSQMATTM